MCGIAGFYLREGQASLSAVRAMCDQIRHRGPDDEGYHVEGGCAIGMRRLSIIDLSTGHQPMANEDESIWVVFNGEIYNYRELRRDLLARGHRFATNISEERRVGKEWRSRGSPYHSKKKMSGKPTTSAPLTMLPVSVSAIRLSTPS